MLSCFVFPKCIWPGGLVQGRPINIFGGMSVSQAYAVLELYVPDHQL